MLLLYVVVIPTTIGIFITCVETDKLRLRFGVLTQPFRVELSWWAKVWAMMYVFRRAAVIAVVMFLTGTV